MVTTRNAVKTLTIFALTLQSTVLALAVGSAPVLADSPCYTDNFSTYPVGQPPTGWTQYGSTNIVPTVQDYGGVGPSFQVLNFPLQFAGQTTKWLMKNNLTSGPATVTTKLNFQSNNDEAGLSIAFQDTSNEIRVTANPFFADLTLISVVNGVWQQSTDVGRGNLPVSLGQDYWLRLQTTDSGAPGGKTIVASWSTDGVNFSQEATLTNLPNIAGQTGYITWSYSPPSVNFDDFAVSGTCSGNQPVPLMKQGIYPFNDGNPPWEGLTYDSAASQTLGCGTTITQCGCALTSVAMVLASYGVNEGPDGVGGFEATNPSTLNSYFLSNRQCTN